MTGPIVTCASGKKLFHGMREQVRARMPDDLEAVGILVRDDRDLGIGVDTMSGVDELAVDAAGERRLGEAGPDGRGDLGHRDGMIKRTDRAVRQFYVHKASAIKKCGRAALFHVW